MEAQTNSSESLVATISREMVRLYKDLFGRGPVKSRTNWAGQDILICTLEQSLTAAEQNLRDFGEHNRLRDTRMLFQHASEKDFRETIEKLTGRKIRAFVSGMDTTVDLSSEVFYFEPLDPTSSEAPRSE
jgi:uncharacterized protein YbcI